MNNSLTVAIAQMNSELANIESNVAKHIEYIRSAKKKNCGLEIITLNLRTVITRST